MKTCAKNVFVGLVLLPRLIISIECICPIYGSRYDDESSLINSGQITSDVLCKNPDLLLKNPNNETMTYVTVKYSPHYFNIDEADSLFDVNGFLNVSWKNEHVRWDPREYGSLTYVNVNFQDLWMPALMGSIRAYLELDEVYHYFFNTIIQFDGTIIWKSERNNWVGPCQHDPRAWPFGLWVCRIRLIQLDKNERVQLNAFDPLVNVNLDELRENDIWSVVSEPYFTVAEVTNTSLELSITLQRHTSYYAGYILFLSCIVLFLLSLASFWMTDRIYYRITINTISAFAQLVILLLMVWLLRRSGSKGNPLMCFLEDSLFISLIGILLAAINAQLLGKTSNPPKYVMKIIDGVSIVPFVGPVFHNFISGNVHSPSVFVADEIELITDVHVGDNPEWRTVRSALDKCVLILVVLYFLKFRFL